MLSCFTAPQNLRTRQNNDKSNSLFFSYIHYLYKLYYFSNRTRCRYLNIINTRICVVGAKCEVEIITISTNFSCCFLSYNQDECIFNVSLLDLDFCLK